MSPAPAPRRAVRAAAAVLAAAALLTGCAQSVDPIERLGKKAAQSVRSHTPAARQPYRRWGLPAPLAPAPRPASRPAPPRTAGPALAPVVDHVPTRDRVVFLTYDDGAEKDPRFVDMVRELRLPVSLFLTDTVVGPGYAHFARLRSVGAGVQNHTLDHPALPGLPYAGQRAEICGQQDKLTSRFGIRPRFFRPPYDRYDTTTLRAAADCGVAAVVLWRATVTSGGLSYTHGDHRLRPGDIVQIGPDDIRERTTRVLRRLQKEGLTVARIEDYL
ncbi:polysaccharide deacetylase family protein [Streptomyces sp. V3I7]|uniref:polysaccharide deacetylase family protein n=1 Tax=Streptomyces sp. V3I7 TaxID=3042278 RepID=UPI00278651EF|nr:polysaccharide deacetylase family protein [Streptomyces sp. V3I7]MDQ0992531.1 peptidoglycan/xylan/chitin deacetylase (PgdA/CDA1 family) [Streptomyces sp. V3I7]